MAYLQEGSFQKLQALRRVTGYRVTWIDDKNRRHVKRGFSTFPQAQGFANNLPYGSRAQIQPVLAGVNQ